MDEIGISSYMYIGVNKEVITIVRKEVIDRFQHTFYHSSHS